MNGFDMDEIWKYKRKKEANSEWEREDAMKVVSQLTIINIAT